MRIFSRLADAAAIVLAAVAMCASDAIAQQSTGTIAGRVVDEQDAGIADAAVRAHNAGTGFTREVTTDESGLYVLGALPAGSYDVTAIRQGLTRFERMGIV